MDACHYTLVQMEGMHTADPKVNHALWAIHCTNAGRPTVTNVPLWWGMVITREVKHVQGRPEFIPGLGRSPGERKGYPPQYSGLKNSMDCIVHGVAKSWTQLSDFHLHFQGV